MTLNANTTVTATFTPQPLVQLVGSAAPLLSLTDAYANASDGAELRARAISLSGDLHLNRAIGLSIEGGYDAGFATVTGFTTLQGILSIEQGSAIVGNVIIQ